MNLTILLPGMPPMYSRRAYDMFFLTRKLLAFIVIVMLEGLGLKNLLEGVDCLIPSKNIFLTDFCLGLF